MAIGRPVSLTSNVASKSISVTATENQTLFTVTGGYRINELAVFRNGARLSDGADYTARDGATVTLIQGANLNDTVEFQIFDTFRVAEAIQTAEADQTINGNLTVTGTLTGTTVTGAAIGIQSGGTVVGAAKTLNFIGTGNTFLMNGDTVDISISSGGGSGVASTITVADESSDTTCFPVFVTAATGNVNPKTRSNLTFNSNTGDLSVSGQVSGATGSFTGQVSGATGSFTGNVSIGGTLTYEDVTNVDSVGIITARSGIRIGTGGTVGPVGSGIVTYFGDGSNLTGVVSGIEVKSAGSSVGTSLTAINFQSGATITTGSAGITTVTISAGISSAQSSPSANTVVTLNLGTAQHHDLRLSAGITTITCTGGSAGDSHSIVITQPSSGTATVGFSTYFLFPSGATPAMSESGSKVDLVSFVIKTQGSTGVATELLASAGLNYSN